MPTSSHREVFKLLWEIQHPVVAAAFSSQIFGESENKIERMESKIEIPETEREISGGKIERTFSQSGIPESERDFAEDKNGRTESQVGISDT